MVERFIHNRFKEIKMKITKANRITIFGGGTSGWLTAAYLVKNLKFPCEITLIESTELGPIGVGEGTQPATARFLFDCGISPKTWMKPSNAVFKLGVEFVGWTEENFFVDNDFIENTQIGPDLYAPDYFIGKTRKEYFDWLPAYQLAKENKSPKLAGMDTNYALTGDRQFGAVHFSAYDILESLKTIIGDKIKYFDTKIVDITMDDYGINELIDQEGRKHTADLFIDCTGFASILLEKKLGIDFISVNDILPCDRAVAIPTKYKDPIKECRPLTTATAMNAGWRWTIPIYTRIGNGYVYSSKYITPEEAEQELRESLNEFEAPAKHLTMKCGIHSMVAHKNVCAAGLSAGFVEPLEATGITFTTKAVEILTQLLNQHQGIWNSSSIKTFNNVYQRTYWEIVSFVWAHYHFSKKSDTEFWRSIHRQPPSDIPEVVLDVVGQFAPSLTRKFFLHPDSNFHVGHWFQVLNATGVYENSEKVLDGEKELYAKYFIENQTFRVEKIKEYFPNHYEFLKKWYNE